jgi:addiction module RelE/StbE family toxin
MPEAGAALNTVIWSSAALEHLKAIRTYIAQFNPHAAQAVAAELIEAGNNLENFPHRGRAVPGSDKRELVTVYPYVIRYRVAGNVVRILRVRHTARRPTDP